jgi:hypothetical protein
MPQTSRVMITGSGTNIVILVEKINHFKLKSLSPVILDAGPFDIHKETPFLYSVIRFRLRGSGKHPLQRMLKQLRGGRQLYQSQSL